MSVTQKWAICAPRDPKQGVQRAAPIRQGSGLGYLALAFW